jgi:hypothetical protein
VNKAARAALIVEGKVVNVVLVASDFEPTAGYVRIDDDTAPAMIGATWLGGKSELPAAPPELHELSDRDFVDGCQVTAAWLGELARRSLRV